MLININELIQYSGKNSKRHIDLELRKIQRIKYFLYYIFLYFLYILHQAEANKNYHIFLRGQSSSQNKIFPVARINIAIFNIQRENSEALFVLIEVAWAGRKEPNRRRTDNKNNDHVKKRNGGERARSRSPSVLRPPKLIKSLRHCTMAN